ncbi:MAG: DUF3488 domain-containing protein [Planctomycetes bacterium]|nr:DUF3488 domain-containing protein [Planctomycetota bacterium]
MSDVRDVITCRRHAMWLAVVSLVAFALSQRSLALGLVAIVVAAASWMVTSQCTRRMLHPTAVLVLVSVVAAVVISQVWPRLDPARIPRWIGLGVFFGMLVRLWARRSISDERQVVLLSGVLLVAAGLHSIDLAVGMLIIAGTALAVDCVIRFRLLTPRDLAGPAPASRRQPLRGRPQSERDLRRVIIASLILTLLTSAVIFVILPRNPNPGGPLFGTGRGSRLGFPSDMSLRSPQWIEPGDRELLSVEWLGPDGKPPPVAETLRLRGQVLDRYDPVECRWFARIGPSQRFIINDGADRSPLALSPIDERINTHTLRVHYRGLYTDILFTPWITISIRGLNPQVFAYSPLTCSLQLVDIETAGVVRGYETRVQPFPAEAALNSLQGNPQRLPPPPSFPVDAVRDTALQWMEEGGLAGVAAAGESDERWARNIRIGRAFEERLRSEQFTYSLDLRGFVVGEGRDPIDLFLREYRFGHCEYFASALCALCQSVGVDARIVTGFIVHEYDAGDRRYSVREADAHAWVEIRSGSVQWTVLDPTPMADDTSLASERSVWGQVLRFLLGPLEDAWRERIERFDSLAQEEFVRGFNEWIARAIRQARAWPGAMAESLAERTGIQQAGVVWIAAVLVGIAFSSTAALLLWRRVQRRRRLLGLSRTGRMRARVALRDGAFYADSLALLAAFGCARPAWQSPRAFAESLRSKRPAAAEAMHAIIDRYYVIRFAGRRPDAVRRLQDAALVERLRAALARADAFTPSAARLGQR